MRLQYVLGMQAAASERSAEKGCWELCDVLAILAAACAASARLPHKKSLASMAKGTHMPAAQWNMNFKIKDFIFLGCGVSEQSLGKTWELLDIL